MSKESSNNSCSSTEQEDIDWSQVIIKNRYIILNKLGSGSYCSVWAVYDVEKRKMYALKIYNEEDTDDAYIEKKTMDIIKSFNIQNVLLYSDFFTYDYEDDTYAMQLIELCGYSLNNLIKLFKNDFKTDSELYSNYINFLYRIITDLTIIITKLHTYEYSHTDIKPENILIDIPNYENKIILETIQKFHSNILKKKGKAKNIINELHKEIKEYINNINISENEIKNYLKDFNYGIKLCDFGTALKMGDKTIHKKHTQYYKSPKIILKYELDNTYDFWSIGCTIYELLTSVILFDPYNSEIENKYGENDDRNLMYLIVSALGIPNKKILENSKVSDIFFTSDNKCSRGYFDIKYKSFITELINNISYLNDNIIINKYIELMQLIIKFVNYDMVFT